MKYFRKVKKQKKQHKILKKFLINCKNFFVLIIDTRILDQVLYNKNISENRYEVFSFLEKIENLKVFLLMEKTSKIHHQIYNN